jgi:chromosome segregation ATPase
VKVALYYDRYVDTHYAYFVALWQERPFVAILFLSMLLNSLRLCNFLSYSPDAPEVPLQPLNILIGANGSGKSNFIEGICVLRETSRDLQKKLRTGGGVLEWINKNSPDAIASIEIVLSNKQLYGRFHNSGTFTIHV